MKERKDYRELEVEAKREIIDKVCAAFMSLADIIDWEHSGEQHDLAIDFFVDQLTRQGNLSGVQLNIGVFQMHRLGYRGTKYHNAHPKAKEKTID